MSKGRKRADVERAAPGEAVMELTVRAVGGDPSALYSALRSAGEFIEREVPGLTQVTWYIEEN